LSINGLVCSSVPTFATANSIAEYIVAKRLAILRTQSKPTAHDLRMLLHIARVVKRGWTTFPHHPELPVKIQFQIAESHVLRSWHAAMLVSSFAIQGIALPASKWYLSLVDASERRRQPSAIKDKRKLRNA
jgi:hypothetical protein